MASQEHVSVRPGRKPAHRPVETRLSGLIANEYDIAKHAVCQSSPKTRRKHGRTSADVYSRQSVTHGSSYRVAQSRHAEGSSRLIVNESNAATCICQSRSYILANTLGESSVSRRC
ncbi:hypothetical protein HGRIS_012125 [Hohenbuehelia grisea]|uniref:Uncharacterized protein n=1 Tax=Hohenbuehelia grisea TaxID=104357 RepID=A0ABR3IRB9_9AGAR